MFLWELLQQRQGGCSNSSGRQSHSIVALALLAPYPSHDNQGNHVWVILIQSDQVFSYSLRIPGVCSLDKHNDSRVLARQFCACYPEFCWPSSFADEDGKLVIKSFFISGISILPQLEKGNYLTTYNLKEYYCA